MFGAQDRSEPAVDLHPERVQPPHLPVVGPEAYVPVEGNDSTRLDETGLLSELTPQRRLEVPVRGFDLSTHRYPDPAAGRRSTKEQKLERWVGEQVSFDALPDHGSGRLVHLPAPSQDLHDRLGGFALRLEERLERLLAGDVGLVHHQADILLGMTRG